MKIVYTNHAKKKFSDLLMFGIKVKRSQVKNAIDNPKYESQDNSNKIAVCDFDEKHNLRAVYRAEKVL